jgi:alpha-amylase
MASLMDKDRKEHVPGISSGESAMKTVTRRVVGFFAFALALFIGQSIGRAQAGLNDDRVMIQGFYWESYRYGHPAKFSGFPNEAWYSYVKDRADQLKQARFDLIWLPPPTYAGEFSAGYNPKELFKFDNSYGTMAQQRALLVSLLNAGIEPVADLVLNHRDGNNGWADFKNPDWGPKTICADDEAFSNPASEVNGLPLAQRGAAEEPTLDYARGRRQTYSYGDFRDIDHANPVVRTDTLRMMLSLKSLGYRGWRYDMVHGYQASHIADYNRVTQPTFSVGEYDWGAHQEQRGWIWYTATSMTPTGNQHLQTASSVFDFTTFYSLHDAITQSRYTSLYGFGGGIGMVGDNTDGIDWKNRSVTFVENHDTGYRTDENGNPQKDHTFDTFANNWQVEQAYALILTHPGLPCVYWKHYFEWGNDLQTKIAALINARKVAGVHAGSAVHLQDNARSRGVYAAFVEGTHGSLYVRIGGDQASWQPSDSGYSNYRDYAHGAGWQVWVALPTNPEVQQATLKPAFPAPPAFQTPDAVTIPSP